MAKKEYGDNVMADITEAGTLTIEIDTKKNFGASKSGKTITIASTRGNVRLQDEDGNEIVMGINVYKYPEAK